MGVFVMLVPILLLLCAVAMLGSVLFSGRAGDVFRGVLLRDFFWFLVRGLVAVVCLPFLLISWLVYSRARQRKRSDFGGRRHRGRG